MVPGVLHDPSLITNMEMSGLKAMVNSHRYTPLPNYQHGDVWTQGYGQLTHPSIIMNIAISEVKAIVNSHNNPSLVTRMAMHGLKTLAKLHKSPFLTTSMGAPMPNAIYSYVQRVYGIRCYCLRNQQIWHEK